MKRIIFILGLLVLVFSCGKKEELKFEAFSPEAFAYDIGDGWELNATVNVRGFGTKETDDQVSVSLSYSVDLINPNNEETIDIFSDSKEVTKDEVNYVQLEAQFELDSTNVQGMYKVIFNVTDNISNKTSSAQVEFELED